MIVRMMVTVWLMIVNLHADDYARGKAIFNEECRHCHIGHIPADRLKKNFFEMNNTLLNLTAPTVNMLAYAIMDGPKKIGDPSDPEMRQAEIEEYLKEMLEHPDRDNSICDPTVMKHYAMKRPLSHPLSDDEYAALARFFMEYKSRRLAENRTGNRLRKLEEFSDERSILSEAKRRKRHIIIEAESPQCHYCRKMEREVIESLEVRKVLDRNYLMIRVNVERSQLPFGLKKVYRHITPSFFILDSEGHLLSHYPGSWKKDDFLQILRENLSAKKEKE